MIEPPPTVVKTFSQRWFDWFSSLYNYVKGLESNVIDVTKVPYNAKGDGVTDDTAAIQAAIDAAGTNSKKLIGGAGDTYLITSAITTSGYVDWDFQGSTIDATGLATAVSLDEIIAISITGSKASSISVTVAVTAGDSSITVADSSTLVADDWVFLESEDAYPVGATTSTDRGMIHQIDSITSSTVIVLKESALFDYTTTVVISKLTLIDEPKVRNLTINCGGVGEGHNGLKFEWCYKPFAYNVNVDAAEDVGIHLANSVNGLVRKGHSSNSTSSATIGNTGYGVLVGSGTLDCTVAERTSDNCRHSIAGGGLHPSIRTTLNKCISKNSGISTQDVDNHEDCVYWLIKECVSYGGGDSATRLGGFNCRGQYITFDSCSVINGRSANGAFQIKVFDTTPNEQAGIRIINPYIENCASGISVQGSSSGRVIDSEVVGGLIVNSGISPIQITQADRFTVNGTRIIADDAMTNNDGQIRIVGDVTDFCTEITIKNVYGKDSSHYGVVADFCNGLYLDNNTFLNVGRHGVEVISCTDVNIIGGQYDAPNLSFGYGVYAEDCTQLNVTGARLSGDLTNTSSHGVRTIDTDQLGVVSCALSGFQRPVYSTATGGGSTDLIRVVANDVGDCASTIDITAATTTYSAGNI